MTTTNEQADRIFTEYRRQVELVRANKSLSREGRRASLADIYLTSKEKMAAVFEKENGQREARRQVLERALFGISELRGDPASLTISRRDAMDRVERRSRTRIRHSPCWPAPLAMRCWPARSRSGATSGAMPMW
jgi:hypothetical protein